MAYMGVTVTDANAVSDSNDGGAYPPMLPMVNFFCDAEKCGDDGQFDRDFTRAVLFNWETVPSTGTIGTTDTLSGLSGGLMLLRLLMNLIVPERQYNLVDVVPLNIIDTSFVEPLATETTMVLLGIVVQDGQPPYVNYE
ncbi:MAG: hypothetical protein R2778_18480 [Saprospiraceae bacterium]